MYSEVPCPVKTTSGKCCSFPFNYEGVTYKDCTKANHHRVWCSLDPTYKGKWGKCREYYTLLTPTGILCTFFFYIRSRSVIISLATILEVQNSRRINRTFMIMTRSLLCYFEIGRKIVTETKKYQLKKRQTNGENRQNSIRMAIFIS